MLQTKTILYSKFSIHFTIDNITEIQIVQMRSIGCPEYETKSNKQNYELTAFKHPKSTINN